MKAHAQTSKLVDISNQASLYFNNLHGQMLAGINRLEYELDELKHGLNRWGKISIAL
tara:strand:- start:115 stop:285 length:171 start_codon:yes stop_codon:yes gene_type:complete